MSDPQVALNQLALAPVVLAAVFAWNLGLTNQLAALPGKIRRDLVPSMINGRHNLSTFLFLFDHDGQQPTVTRPVECGSCCCQESKRSAPTVM